MGVPLKVSSLALLLLERNRQPTLVWKNGSNDDDDDYVTLYLLLLNGNLYGASQVINTSTQISTVKLSSQILWQNPLCKS